MKKDKIGMLKYNINKERIKCTWSMISCQSVDSPNRSTER